MLGWHISIYRLTDGGLLPATPESPSGTRLAVWQTGLNGLDWIAALVPAKQAVCLGGNGYPVRYSALAKNLLPQLIDGPPAANQVWISEKDDILTEKWEGKTVIDNLAVAACQPSEWLLVEAWDKS
jgi:hypothetical protein